MRKLLVLCLAAAAIVAFGCNKPESTETSREVPGTNPPGTTPEPPEPGPENPGTNPADAIVGLWSLVHDDFEDSFSFTDDGKVEFVGTFEKRSGTWSFENDALTLSYTEFWQRDYERESNGAPKLDDDGQFIFGDWVKAGHEPYSDVYSNVKLLCEGSVMAMLTKAEGDGGTQYDELIGLLFKEGGKLPNDISALEGKWYWQMFGSQGVRTAVIVSGNNAEVIITPWGERYVGAAQYNNGYLDMNRMTFYTSRYLKNPDDPNSYGDWINNIHPEETEWRIPGEGEGGIFGAIHMAFVVDGDVAYGVVANLFAIFYKQ